MVAVYRQVYRREIRKPRRAELAPPPPPPQLLLQYVIVLRSYKVKGSHCRCVSGNSSSMRATRMFASAAGNALMLPNQWDVTEPSWLRLHQEAREILGTKLTAFSLGNGAGASSWLALAQEQEGRKDYGAARRSLRRALSLNKRFPQLSQRDLSNAHTLMGLLVLGDGRKLPEARAEHHLRAAVTADPCNAHALWHLGQVLVAQGDATSGEAELRAGLAVIVASGARESAIALGCLRSDVGQALQDAEAADDARAFQAFCDSSAALAFSSRGPSSELPRKLAEAAAELRQHVECTEWLVKWGIESASLFGAFGPQWNAAAYGETPFKSWQRVVERPAVAAALAGATSTWSTADATGTPMPHVLICGCALGYMCLYFRALGATCAGVDLLAESMVRTASTVLENHGLDERCGVQLRAGDALLVCLDKEEPRPSVIWINDEAWSAKVRRAMLQRAACLLKPGGVVVSYGRSARHPSTLVLADRLSVQVSWDTRFEEIRILMKRS